ncbi:MAG: hypothetical protein AAFU71_06405 [Cyanobacteria bacterium J06632_22]
MSDLLYRCFTKATTAEGDDIRRSLNWVTARRTFLKVYTDRIECGPWLIPHTAIDEAVLFRVTQFFIPGYVLRIKTHCEIYQFGLNWNPFWKGDLPFPVERSVAHIKWSAFSIAVRLAALGGGGFLLWDYFAR